MKQNFALMLSLMGGLMLLASACVKEKTDDEKLRPVGSEIIFAAATSYDNEDGTRTVYTGKDQSGNDVTTNSTIERIDWENNDRVSIVYATGSSQSEYKVTNVLSSNNENDLADVVATGTKLTWASGDNQVFYAMYPTANGNHANDAASLSGTTVSGTIPASQSLGTSNNTQNHPKYLPDMKYAYMVGYANNSCIDGSRVTIPFTPAVTAFNFIFKAASAVTVTGFEMTTTESGNVGTDLTGNFSFNISGPKMRNSRVVGAEWGTVTKTSTGKTITVNFGSDISLTANQYLDFTVFTLPIAQTGITIKFHLKNVTNGVTTNYTKSLDLKDGASTWHTFAAGKKHVVTNDKLAGDSITYTLTVTSSLSFAFTGESKTYSVTSYKQIGSKSEDRIPVQWKVAGYSTDGGSTWTTTKPTHLTTFTTGQTPTTTSSVSFTAKMAPTPRTGTLGGRTPVGSESSPYDLSTHDILGNSISQTTANCYVITAPGWYMFPMVYGNARKNGENNTQAYNPTNQSSSYFLDRMVNHKGEDMNIWVSNSTSNTAFTIKTVSLVWQDSKGLISNLQFHSFTPQANSNGYVKFYVAPEFINPGNAVIAVKDADGKIAWSWHIWVTDQDMNAATIRGKSFMKVNLGYCAAGSYTNNARSIKVKMIQPENPSVEKILTLSQTKNSETVTLYRTNPHYQWGRKDPFIPPMGLGQTGNKTIYNASGGTITGIVVHGSGSTAYGTIPRGILNPTTLYVNTIKDETPWLSAPKCNLWNYTQTAPTPSQTVNNGVVANSPQTHGKTVYDPCPIGYTVPNARDMAKFQTIATNSYSNTNSYSPSWGSYGWTFDSNFWGAMGHRSRIADNISFTDAASNNFQTYGYYYTSVAYMASSKNCIYLEFTSTKLYLYQGAQSAANSIRCVAE